MSYCRTLILVVLLLVLFTPAMAQDDLGAPDSLFLNITTPTAGITNQAVTMELWGFCDANKLMGISVGFSWVNDNLRLDSVVNHALNWDTKFLYDEGLQADNLSKRLLYAGIAFSESKALQPMSTRQPLATYFFTLSSCEAGDLIIVDTSEFSPGAEMMFAILNGKFYKPHWIGGDAPIVIVANDRAPKSLYISPDGDNSNPGTIYSPKSTIDGADNVAIDGDTIQLLPGVYTGPDNTDQYIRDKSITIMSTDGAAVTTIDFGHEAGGLRFNYYNSINPISASIDGITFRNAVRLAVYTSYSDFRISNCVFEDNSGNNYGAALQIRLSTGATEPTRVINCRFTNNSVQNYIDSYGTYREGRGAAVFIYGVGSAHLNNGVVFESCLFDGNTSTNDGSAVFNYNPYTGINLQFEECTFVNNVADSGSTITLGQDGTDSLQMNNCLIAFNQNMTGPVSHWATAPAFNISISCTDIFGNSGGDWVGLIGDQADINNNLSVAPLFCDLEGGDYHVNDQSPCASANNDCGTTIGAFGVGCKAPGELKPTNEWISIYCGARVTLDDVLAKPNTQIRAYDPDGVLCGIGTVNENHQLPMFSVFRDDIYSPEDEGAEPGDRISFTIGGKTVGGESPVIWTQNGDINQVCYFEHQRCQPIELQAGWNLISWNVNYTAPTGEAIAGIEGCVDVILSFEEGGLTYDPTLVEFSSLQTLDYHHGYWFRMNCPATLYVCGQDIDNNESIMLETGWNLLSYWPQTSFPIEEAFGTNIRLLEVATGFKQGAQVWVADLDQFNTLTQFDPGFGYWARVTQDFNLAWPGFYFAGDSSSVDPNYPIVATQSSRLLKTAVIPSRNWMSAYGNSLTLDNSELTEGAIVQFSGPSGIVCGEAIYSAGLLEFCSIYGADQATELTAEYPSEFDEISIEINGQLVDEKIIYGQAGERLRLSRFTSSTNNQIPSSYQLAQNYPNPFNPETKIGFSLPESGHVSLKIFNVIGQELVTLIDSEMPAGNHEIVWNGRSRRGQPVASGIYLYRLKAGSFENTKKMLLTK